MPSGNPEPAISWQQKVGGFWREVDRRLGRPDRRRRLPDGRRADRRDERHPVPRPPAQRGRHRLHARGDADGRRRADAAGQRSAAATSTGGSPSAGAATSSAPSRAARSRSPAAPRRSTARARPARSATAATPARRRCASRVRGGSYDPASGRLEVRLDGAVRFWGHDYHVPGSTTPQLDTRFANLRIVVENGVGTSSPTPSARRWTARRRERRAGRAGADRAERRQPRAHRRRARLARRADRR